MSIRPFLAALVLALFAAGSSAHAGKLSAQAADFFFCIGMNTGLHAVAGTGKAELTARVAAAMTGPCESAYEAYEADWARHVMSKGGWSSLKSRVYREFREHLQEALAERLAQRLGP